MENNSHYSKNITAVIFDLDGTLLNTEQLTKNVLKDFLAKYGKVQDTEKEKKRMGLTFKESSEAVIAEYQLPLTPDQFYAEISPMYQGKWLEAKALPGANRLMEHLHKHGVPFSLASNSMTKNIQGKVANQVGWAERFETILGSDQVQSGKPAPDIFLEAAKRMKIDPSNCLVIEDSAVGVKAGKSAGMKVVAVPSLQLEIESFSIADSVLHSILEFRPELWGLPPFKDWVENVLPIDPIHLSGVFSKGLLHKYTENGTSFLADQIWGLYIGWAKFDGEKAVKAVISIGWSISCCGSKRKIQVCMIDGSEENKHDSDMQLLIVGYLRRSYDAGTRLVNLDILDEDKSSADAALDSTAFSHKLCKSFSP